MAGSSDDTEITLGAGKLLGLFFLLVAICGVFFAIGYSLGKNSAKEQALNDRANETVQSADESSPGVSKPSAAVQGRSEGSTTTEEKPADPGPDLTFYKAVKQNGAEAASAAQAPQKATTTIVEKPAGSEVPVETTPSTAGSPATKAGTAVPASSGGEYLVQIAAVTHEEDAVALAGALRKKSYSASVVNNPEAKDTLYHVVIGPFATKQDAEAMKLRLTSEGYSPIVKR